MCGHGCQGHGVTGRGSAAGGVGIEVWLERLLDVVLFIEMEDFMRGLCLEQHLSVTPNLILMGPGGRWESVDGLGCLHVQT